MDAVLGKRPDENVRPAALRTVPQRAEELEEGTGTQSSRQARARALRHRVRSRLGAVRLPAGRSGPDRTAAAQLPLHPLAATAAAARTAGARVTVLEAAEPSLLRVAPVHEVAQILTRFAHRSRGRAALRCRGRRDHRFRRANSVPGRRPGAPRPATPEGVRTHRSPVVGIAVGPEGDLSHVPVCT
ncbi:hypothetical protein GCM10010381_22960 [Streptomyces xantholiticus]|nr:hypothetical protein GCM10010381_22960 [Streptomyces xantholiticus]